MTALLVLAGAMLGAPARYLVDQAVRARHGSAFPWGTWLVNVTGSFLLGLLVTLVAAGQWPDWLLPGLGVGFCGALTTYSTFGYETVRLLDRGMWSLALANVVGSLLAGLTAVLVGVLAGTLLASLG